MTGGDFDGTDEEYRPLDRRVLDWATAEERFPECSAEWDALGDLVDRERDFILYESSSGRVLWAAAGHLVSLNGGMNYTHWVGDRWYCTAGNKHWVKWRTT
jgi:hypothetical protein